MGAQLKKGETILFSDDQSRRFGKTFRGFVLVGGEKERLFSLLKYGGLPRAVDPERGSTLEAVQHWRCDGAAHVASVGSFIKQNQIDLKLG
jgi:hypothetical protein